MFITAASLSHWCHYLNIHPSAVNIGAFGKMYIWNKSGVKFACTFLRNGLRRLQDRPEDLSLRGQLGVPTRLKGVVTDLEVDTWWRMRPVTFFFFTSYPFNSIKWDSCSVVKSWKTVLLCKFKLRINYGQINLFGGKCNGSIILNT